MLQNDVLVSDGSGSHIEGGSIIRLLMETECSVRNGRNCGSEGMFFLTEAVSVELGNRFPCIQSTSILRLYPSQPLT